MMSPPPTPNKPPSSPAATPTSAALRNWTGTADTKSEDRGSTRCAPVLIECRTLLKTVGQTRSR